MTATTIYAKQYSDRTVKMFCRPCLERSGGMTPRWFAACLAKPMHGVCANADYPDCADVCESLAHAARCGGGRNEAMSTTKRSEWTPGPWVAHASTRYRGDIGMAFDIATQTATWDPHDSGEDGLRGEWQYPHGYERVATTSDAGNSAANARLIAAAPELADALTWLLRFANESDHHSGSWPKALAAARAALARARGEAVPQ